MFSYHVPAPNRVLRPTRLYGASGGSGGATTIVPISAIVTSLNTMLRKGSISFDGAMRLVSRLNDLGDISSITLPALLVELAKFDAVGTLSVSSSNRLITHLIDAGYTLT